MNREESLSEVSIGNVSGGVQGSIIAGRDVSNATITIGGQPTLADKEPTFGELKQLLAEIQRELAELVGQKEALEAISSVAPFIAQGAESSVQEAAAEVEGQNIERVQAKSIHSSLKEATEMLSGILDGAKTVAKKAAEVGQAVAPIAETLEPLVEKLGVAALWVAKLWLIG